MFAKRILLAFIIIGAMATVAGAQSETETNTAASAEATHLPPIRVDCDAGQKIGHALQLARPGRTIRVTGTCKERVTITTDRLTLDGRGRAILDGAGGTGTDFDGVVIINSASGVTITGFTIQNGASGIVGQRGAAFAVRNTIVQDNAVTGIVVADSSTADLTDCTMQRNGAGLDVFTGSSAVLRRTINITENALGGVSVNGNSVLEIRGATVNINNNHEFGLIAGPGSQVALFGFDESKGSTLTANGNSLAGIGLGEDTTLSVFASNTTISAENNPIGIFLPASGLISSPFGRGTFLIKNNGIGLNFGQGSGAIIVGGLNVQNNGTGVLADAAGPLTLVSIPPNPSSITGNTDVDVNLSFGTRSTINAVAVGTITCDGTVLSRGTTACP